MTNHYYSTRELAVMLKANESTVKRWADSGKLKCFRTPGGHRKFPPWHVSDFLKRFGYELFPLGEDRHIHALPTEGEALAPLTVTK